MSDQTPDPSPVGTCHDTGTNAPRQVHYKMANFNWSDVQWVVDPQYWAMVCCISRAEDTELWRVVYGEPIGLSPEQLRARLPEKFEKILPGHPKPDDYEIVRFSPFTVHQRCVEKMRVGRVLLVGDAAHLCNPMSVSWTFGESPGR